MADARTDKLLRKSFQEIQNLRTALQEAKAASTEPIAIVGMACRTPGGVRDPEGYWKLLAEGRDAVVPFPPRWKAEEVFDPDPEAEGKCYVRESGHLDDVDAFDADFFGISPREAAQMDPQQRLMLEVTWQALEDAGIVPSTLRESTTGVYTGAMGSDYGVTDFDFDALDGYRTTGTLGAVLSGRISYTLGLQGPSLSVDTACSSSLTALHLACAGLRQGDCSLALAGGVMVMSTPSTFIEFSRQRALSPDGRCRSFAAEADGTSWSEGCGVLVLKRLSDAERDGDRVLSVIRATAVNQDGRSQGLTVPNGPSQQRVIRRALELARLEPDDIDAIEAHGTGTSLGDPIEANSLREVFGPNRRAETPLWLGSSKSNIGHSQSAAGILGVIKMVLALCHERLPKTLHCTPPTEHVAWEGSGLRLLQDACDWPRSPDRVRRAGVSSFGISGTNAHVVLEEAPAQPEQERPPIPPIPLLISAPDAQSLSRQAEHWARWLEQHPHLAWDDVRATAASRRTHFDLRASITGSDRATAIDALRALARAAAHSDLTVASVKDRKGVVFVFPGHGSQWPTMASDLLRESKVFAKAIEDCDQALRPHVGWSLREVLQDAERETIDRVDVLQPVLFAMGVALAAVWQSLGVKPTAVVGHSVGEIAAAHVAGNLDLQQAARLVALRGRAIAAVSRQGAMLHVPRPVSESRELLAPWSASVAIAAVNDRRSTVVSGDREAIAELSAHLTERGITGRDVQIGFAAHSPHMDEVQPLLRAQLSNLQPREGSIPFYSSVLARRVDGTHLCADYWCRNVRDVVRFGETAECLVNDSHTVFVECGAHPVLAMPLAEAVGEHGMVVASLSRGNGQLSSLYRGLGQLHAAGVGVDWSSHATQGQFAPAPTYAFNPQRHWLPTRPGKDATAAGLEATTHPLLAARISLADEESVVFSGRLSVCEHPWLRDHTLLDTTVFPGTGALELALSVGRQEGYPEVAELALLQPLVLPDAGAIQLQLLLRASDATGRRAFEIHAREAQANGAWTCLATGSLRRAQPALHNQTAPSHWPPSDAKGIDLSGLYGDLARRGYGYGAAFRGLRWTVTRNERVIGEVAATAEVEPGVRHYDAHPALVDAALHSLLASALPFEDDTVWLPTAWDDVTLHQRGLSSLRFELTPRGGHGDERVFSLEARDSRGAPALSAKLRVQRATTGQLRSRLASPAQDLYLETWESAQLSPAGTPSLCIVGTGSGMEHAIRCDSVEQLLTQLRARTLATPATVVLDLRTTAGAHGAEGPRACSETAEAARRDLRALLSETQLHGTDLVCLAERDALTTAPVRGLLRSARSEHRDRSLRWVEVDESACDSETLRHALTERLEPELRTTERGVLARRLVRAPAVAPGSWSLQPDTTTLITGGLGDLGTALAAHLVHTRGARHLVLTSRRGLDAPGAASAVDSLRVAGAETVEVVKCDCTQRDQLETVLSAIATSDRPLGAVFHLAGVLDDGLFDVMTPEALRRVLAPKVDGAWHLHDLTKDGALSHFVLFSSVAGTLGTVGQSAYAAANTYLDALAERRQAMGLPAQSLAWGLWQQGAGGMGACLGDTELAHLRSQGVAPISQASGLALLDAALARPEATLVPCRLDLDSRVRALGNQHAPEPWMRLLRSASSTSTGTPPAAPIRLKARFSALPDDQRPTVVLATVRTEASAVLRLAGPEAVPADAPLRDLGLDSLMGVELKNRLAIQIDGPLPATLAFDYPTAEAIAQYLLGKLASDLPAPAREWDDDEIREKLSTVSLDALRKAGLLEALMAQPSAPKGKPAAVVELNSDAIQAAEDDSLVELAQRLLSGSES